MSPGAEKAGAVRLAVIRLSAMGDVALVVPAVRAVLLAHPQLTVTLVTRPAFTPFFAGISRLQCIEADVKGKHKGVPGLWKLSREILAAGSPDAVIDLHDVLRSRILSVCFRLGGLPVYRIDKGRKDKQSLTSRHHKRRRPLPHTVDRYLQTFARAGFPASLPAQGNWLGDRPLPGGFLEAAGLLSKDRPWIGIAPFARHAPKRWPLEKTEEIISSVAKAGMQVWLFGGSGEEAACLEAIASRQVGVTVVAGRLSLSGELALIARLDAMISMDSANMHLAALSGIPVISIWGATHPDAGFGPLQGNEAWIVQIPTDRLSCRPCSVFGNKPCFRGDHACMEWISPGEVLSRLSEALGRVR